MPLSQLVYTSEARSLGVGGIQRILEQARAGNWRAKVTGVLIFDGTHFCQCLEGDREQVTALFCKIAADPRHARVCLVTVADVEERDFPNWSMGCVPSDSPDVQATLSEFRPTAEFDPEHLLSPSATALMKRMRDLQRTGIIQKLRR
ncbi:BLUF domain-containing protein [Cryptosporangium minutisporangium]|uniref:BLUF domain-containing protein n=1 Tax=Cryptosporangium minutisporangium TaxID=113569 RepID=A0ABP6SX94_9ACTN